MACTFRSHLRTNFFSGAGKNAGLHLSRLSRGIGEVRETADDGGGGAAGAKKVQVILEPEVSRSTGAAQATQNVKCVGPNLTSTPCHNLMGRKV